MACQHLESMKKLEIKISKNSRGIGMRVCGGIDVNSDDMFDKLIRVKFLIPGEPAMNCGLIDIGDIIVEANGQSMVGITRIESLNILHSSQETVTLKILKPKSLPLPPDHSIYIGNFSPSSSSNAKHPYLVDIKLQKMNGSLGFTITKIDHEGFFVKELTKEPAILEPRISPWDKILRVNGVDLTPMSRNEAIAYLRSLSDEVNLTLEKRSRSESPCFGSDEEQKKKQFRHEVRLMLTDRAKSDSSLKYRRERRRTREIKETS